MNIQLLKSKKFRAAIIAAITSVLSFAVAKLGLNMNVEETITLLTAVMSPFLIYIGAEGYSEADAKRVAEENKVKQAIIDQINKKEQMKKLNKFIAVAGLLLASCTYDANFRSYVLAHRASHDAMAPHYMSYVEKDMDLSPQDKETFRRRAAAEDEMIIQAEKLLGLRK